MCSVSFLLCDNKHIGVEELKVCEQARFFGGKTSHTNCCLVKAAGTFQCLILRVVFHSLKKKKLTD
jgi:hypothetical protein